MGVTIYCVPEWDYRNQILGLLVAISRSLGIETHRGEKKVALNPRIHAVSNRTWFFQSRPLVGFVHAFLHIWELFQLVKNRVQISMMFCTCCRWCHFGMWHLTLDPQLQCALRFRGRYPQVPYWDLSRSCVISISDKQLRHRSQPPPRSNLSIWIGSQDPWFSNAMCPTWWALPL
jgi:hypothetical protein